MKTLALILILFAYELVLAQTAVPENAHWLPDLQVNLYTLSKQLEKPSSLEAKEVHETNLKAIKNLYSVTAPEDTKRKTLITLDDADGIFRRLETDPIVGVGHDNIYDPEGKFGFCFGRAQWVQQEALRMGIDKSSIKKLFLVGPMKAGGITWQFHVATAIKGKYRTLFREVDYWYVIDTTFGGPVSVEKFYATYREQSPDGKLRLFITEPQRLGPSTTSKFSAKVFKSEANEHTYNAYFKDMIEWQKSRIMYENTKQCRYLFPVSSLKL